MKLRATFLTAFLFVLTYASACDITLQAGWVPEAPPGATSAGYGTLFNRGKDPARLEAFRSPQFGAVMAHETRIEDGVARMREITPLTIPAHGEVRFAPGEKHLMLMQPKHPLAAGDTVDIAFKVDGCQDEVFAHLPVREDAAGGKDVTGSRTD